MSAFNTRIPGDGDTVRRYADGEKVMAAGVCNNNGDWCAGVCQLIIPGDSAGVC